MTEQQYLNLLGAINSLRQDLTAEGVIEVPVEKDESVHEMEVAEFVKLREELQELSEVIMETRREIASLQSNASGKKLNAMSDQLDAVVLDTEEATNAILEAVETIETQNESLELNASTAAENEISETIGGAVMQIYEACNFQDISGQRISKVVSTLNFVEERVKKMIDILGGDDELEEIEIVEQDVQMDDEVELSGPQPDGHEISQDEIDSLFD
ncbi:MAG: protein phosphatase CheZ [Proteobacteria bacterium]|nr:protein phosphatase CheZ [Pseudomonadota bacterium]